MKKPNILGTTLAIGLTTTPAVSEQINLGNNGPTDASVTRRTEASAWQTQFWAVLRAGAGR